MDREWFSSQIDKTFDVDPGDGGSSVPLTLVEVTEGQTGTRFRRFSVLFHGPADRALGQGTYTFGHATLDSFAIFIVPVVGSNAERILYEACFSQPVESPARP